MECTHCKKKFTNKSTLTRHQNTAKFCIKIQEETERKENEMRENERRIEEGIINYFILKKNKINFVI